MALCVCSAARASPGARHRPSDRPLSNGQTLWVGENGDGAADALYTHDTAGDERVEDRELDLDERNRAPRSV